MSDDNCLHFLHYRGKHICAKEKWEVGHWMGLRVVIKTFLQVVVDVYIISKNWGELLFDEENWLFWEKETPSLVSDAPSIFPECRSDKKLPMLNDMEFSKMEAYLLPFSLSHFHSLPHKTREHGVWRNESKLPTYNDIFWSLVHSFLFRDQKIVGGNYLVQLVLQLLLERHRQNPKSLSVSVAAEIWTQTPPGPLEYYDPWAHFLPSFLKPQEPVRKSTELLHE